MYVVTDERDSILKRTKYTSGQDVYLYRLRAEPEEMLRCFLDYVNSTNALTEAPRWYHGLTANCTTSIYRQRSRHSAWDWRWLFNGNLDRMLYDHKRVDTSLPFEELKRMSRINNVADQGPIGERIASRPGQR